MKRVVSLLIGAVIILSSSSSYIRISDEDLQLVSVDEIKQMYREWKKENAESVSYPAVITEDATESSVSAVESNQSESFPEETNTPEEFNYVDFDAYFPYADGGQGTEEEIQYLVDCDNVTLVYGDYYHHNTKRFMDLFWQMKPGTTVKIFGQWYTCYGIEHGYTTEYEIYTDAGEQIRGQGTTEIVTCDGGYYTPYRWIARLG